MYALYISATCQRKAGSAGGGTEGMLQRLLPWGSKWSESVERDKEREVGFEVGDSFASSHPAML